jgi:hypothetical protein
LRLRDAAPRSERHCEECPGHQYSGAGDDHRRPACGDCRPDQANETPSTEQPEPPEPTRIGRRRNRRPKLDAPYEADTRRLLVCHRQMVPHGTAQGGALSPNVPTGNGSTRLSRRFGASPSPTRALRMSLESPNPAEANRQSDGKCSKVGSRRDDPLTAR